MLNLQQMGDWYAVTFPIHVTIGDRETHITLIQLGMVSLPKYVAKLSRNATYLFQSIIKLYRDKLLKWIAAAFWYHRFLLNLYSNEWDNFFKASITMNNLKILKLSNIPSINNDTFTVILFNIRWYILFECLSTTSSSN